MTEMTCSLVIIFVPSANSDLADDIAALLVSVIILGAAAFIVHETWVLIAPKFGHART